ncbi:hypothetical protein QZN10_39695 [Burkholderia contaminans]|jgi:uncharacterized membrane protein YfcA|uniref:hypothetical protein n=1 Tax=Burkholderia contaminans TaxID=488447 RepID=UPI00128C8FAB|nr:hypothetical protein [Burkholderia contaminans]MDN8026746.1 hypothetical protein [Burkholderia contaminans]
MKKLDSLMIFVLIAVTMFILGMSLFGSPLSEDSLHKMGLGLIVIYYAGYFYYNKNNKEKNDDRGNSGFTKDAE